MRLARKGVEVLGGGGGRVERNREASFSGGRTGVRTANMFLEDADGWEGGRREGGRKERGERSRRNDESRAVLSRLCWKVFLFLEVVLSS